MFIYCGQDTKTQKTLNGENEIKNLFKINKEKFRVCPRCFKLFRPFFVWESKKIPILVMITKNVNGGIQKQFHSDLTVETEIIQESTCENYQTFLESDSTSVTY